MSLYPSSSKPSTSRTGLTEFEILKTAHKFLRDKEENAETGDKSKSWNDLLAEKYYANLYREFAVCDLKHYKSGNFALRWRTEDEVLSGAGETTCGNTRCDHHHPLLSTPEQTRSRIPLTTLELPFAYEEHGEQKSALVKVVLCDRCVRKMMYKRNKQREAGARATGGEEERGEIGEAGRKGEGSSGRRKRRHGGDEYDEGHAHTRREGHRHKRRLSRSRSRSPKPFVANLA